MCVAGLFGGSFVRSLVDLLIRLIGAQGMDEASEVQDVLVQAPTQCIPTPHPSPHQIQIKQTYLNKTKIPRPMSKLKVRDAEKANHTYVIVLQISRSSADTSKNGPRQFPNRACLEKGNLTPNCF